MSLKYKSAFGNQFLRKPPSQEEEGRAAVAGLLDLGSDGTVISVNAAFASLFGLSSHPDACLSQHYQKLSASLSTAASAIVESLIEIRLRQSSSCDSQDVMLQDGRLLSIDYIPIENGSNAGGHRWIFTDVSEQRKHEQNLKFNANLLSQVTDAVVTIDKNLSITFWNKGAEDLTGYSAAAAIGKSPADILTFRFNTQQDEVGAWKMLTETGSWSGDLVISTPYTASEKHISASATVLKDDDGSYGGILAIVRDETDRREMQDQLIHHAYHDLLTGLPNRMMLLRTLDGLTSGEESGRKFSLLFLDLDRFKMVNDSMGHHAGDALLKKMADRLLDCVRDDDIVARLGGDEFAILLHDHDTAEITCEVADRIMAKLKQPFIVEALEIFSEGSIGIVVGGEHYDLAEDILRDADAAMYQAKRAGRARYEIFDRSQQMKATERFQLESELRRAIERDELRAYFQPIVDISAGELVGFEALLRWAHPSKGIMTPHQFISIAEESDLIIDLDKWLWKTAVDKLAIWTQQFDAARELTISLNCSNRTFNAPDLAEYVGEILSDSGIDGSRLFIEVTEGVIINDPEAAVAEMIKIKNCGVRISIDDFGTGYASLSVLHQLPIDILKIDRSFIKRMDRRDSGGTMLKTIVDLGNSLKLDCVAEGIETQRQLAVLREMKCRYGQGYLFSKPLDGELSASLIEKSEQWISEIFIEARRTREFKL
ncbi:MAG: EAL domain-containing protein [Rhodothermales bacterium]|nr:EAL domain-containing protein [Rhodothermales bacterium]